MQEPDKSNKNKTRSEPHRNEAARTPEHPNTRTPIQEHIRSEINRRTLRRLRALLDTLDARYRAESWQDRMVQYRDRPEQFARHVLGSRWWGRQESVARTLALHRRVAVKSANGVGKTYLAADLALWFLYSHRPSIVLTTAPTWRQVRHVLWEEIRRRFQTARIKLPGSLLTARLTLESGWFAIGLATDDAVKLQGFHARNILIIFDEASGIPDPIWDAAEGVALGENNKILAIGNPLCASGRFYRAFRKASEWKKWTISALEHPNITGKGPAIPGAVTREALAARIADWCEPIHESGQATATTGPPNVGAALCGRPERPSARTPECQNAAPVEDEDPQPEPIRPPDEFEWEGKAYRPNNLFRARVLGQFPTADDESLIPLRWIEAAEERYTTLPAKGFRRAAVDVARYGDDSTVIGLRIGPVVTHIEVVRGIDTMAVAGRINRLAYESQPESIAVDSIGIGAGVVDRLRELGTEGVEAVNVGLPAYDTERFANRRAELYWGLRERFRVGEIAIPPDEQLRDELAAIKYKITSRGQIQMESKDDMKRRGQSSPDRADMLAMLFDSAWEPFAIAPDAHQNTERPSPARSLREEMADWT